MFARNSTEGRVLAIYEVLYAEAPRESYVDLTGIVAKEAAAWSTAQIARGVGQALVSAVTPAETIERDLGLIRVENALDELTVYSRAVKQLRAVGLAEDILSKIDQDLRVITGGNVPGPAPKAPGE